MTFPVRCYTCNKVLADKEQAYRRMVNEQDDEQSMSQNSSVFLGNSKEKILNELGLKRYCCRRIVMTS